MKSLHSGMVSVPQRIMISHLLYTLHFKHNKHLHKTYSVIQVCTHMFVTFCINRTSCIIRMRIPPTVLCACLPSSVLAYSPLCLPTVLCACL